MGSDLEPGHEADASNAALVGFWDYPAPDEMSKIQRAFQAIEGAEKWMLFNCFLVFPGNKREERDWRARVVSKLLPELTERVQMHGISDPRIGFFRLFLEDGGVLVGFVLRAYEGSQHQIAEEIFCDASEYIVALIEKLNRVLEITGAGFSVPEFPQY